MSSKTKMPDEQSIKKPNLNIGENNGKQLNIAAAEDANAFPLPKGKTVSVRLGQSIMLEESSPAPLLRISILFGVFVLVAFLIWAHLAEIDEVTVSSGEIVPSGTIQQIQHIDGGIVTHLLAREGDIVEKGQLLIRLDPTEIDTELKKLTTKAILLTLRIDRLQALASNGEMRKRKIAASYNDLQKEQRELLRALRQDIANQQAVLASKISQRQADLELIREQANTIATQIAPLERQLKIREGLYKNKTLSLYDFLEAERQVMREKGALEELGVKEKAAADALREAEAMEQELTGRFKKEALDELAKANSERAEIGGAIARLKQKAARMNISSPVQGVIQNIEITTIGGVVKPGGTLMRVVPVNQALILETRIRPEDIGHIELGLAATVKFTTYNFSRYGSVKGELTHISATTFEDEEGQNYYKGKIVLSQNYVGNNPERNLILPGMSAAADIRTGTKTLLSYLLKPIHTTVSQAFRER